MSRRVAALIVLSVLALAACGKKTPTGSPEPGEPSPTGSCRVVTITGTVGAKPEITIDNTCPAPTSLFKEDVVVGTGAEAKAGRRAFMQYVGISYSTKAAFDASWNRGQAFDFVLGSGGVIQGWEQGIPGMKVGGRRLLVIPPDLGYGPQGTGPIAPNETLIFVVDLEKVE